jgi:hypothetical protein
MESFFSGDDEWLSRVPDAAQHLFRGAPQIRDPNGY